MGRFLKEPRVVLSDRLVALARGLLEAFHIFNVNVPAPVGNKPGLLQRACHDRNAATANAEHLREKFLRHLQFVPAAKSRHRRSQRHRRASTRWLALQAADC